MSEKFYCIAGRHIPPNDAKKKISKSKGKYYDCKCKNCGKNIRVSMLEGNDKYFTINEIP